ncbi:MAG: GAF domain-containing protein [Deltaproteobacteria bacterium]|nr:GAF domain-containing protein [Deltaproteobacteria bacterium]
MANRKQGKHGTAEGGSLPFERRQEVLQLFKRSAEFYEDLLKENERLRFQVAALEEEQTQQRSATEGPAALTELERQIRQLQQERQSLLDRFSAVEKENADFAARYAEIEEQHDTLANLYISSFQVHSTLRFREVVRVLLEIAINLIGISRMVLYAVDDSRKLLVPVSGDGIREQLDVASLPSIAWGEGVVGQAVASNKRYVADPPGPDSSPLAVIPLAVDDRPIAALVLERFLVQKNNWSPVDFELFTLIGAHGGTALVASMQRADRPDFAPSIDRIKALLAEEE